MCRVAHGNMWSATYYVIVTHRNERTNTPGCANLFRDFFFGVRVRQHYDVNCAGVCGGGGGGYAVCRLPLVMWRHVRVYTRYAKFSVRLPCRMPIRLRQTLAVVPCHPASSTAICRYGWGCVCLCARCCWWLHIRISCIPRIVALVYLVRVSVCQLASQLAAASHSSPKILHTFPIALKLGAHSRTHIYTLNIR